MRNHCYKVSVENAVNIIKWFGVANSSDAEKAEFARYKLSKLVPNTKLHPKMNDFHIKTFNLKVIVKAVINPQSSAVDVLELYIEEGVQPVIDGIYFDGKCVIPFEDARNFENDGLGAVLPIGQHDFFGRYTITCTSPVGLKEQVALAAYRVVVRVHEGTSEFTAYWDVREEPEPPFERFKIVAWTSETAELIDGWEKDRWYRRTPSVPVESDEDEYLLSLLKTMKEKLGADGLRELLS